MKIPPSLFRSVVSVLDKFLGKSGSIVRIEILPQHMEALWADGRVRVSGLPRTEAGIYPAEND